MYNIKLKLFECRRSEADSWEGAILVLAENKNNATDMANEYESNYPKVKYFIKEIELKEGFIYNDYMR